MEIKPLYDTNTIRFVNPTIVQPKKLEKRKAVDPNGVIPNGIFKVIKWEKRRQQFTIGLSALITLASIILITLYFTVFDASWIAIVIPSVVLLLAFYKSMITLGEMNYLKKALLRYSEDLAIGLTDTPPFISRLYLSLNKKQVKHNWITFFLMFYGGLFTLTLWWLKDVSWWIFDFKAWIHSLFSNPDLMVILFTVSLAAIVLIYLVLTIQRKKRLLEIDSYYGSQMMSASDLETIKQTMNKMYRRIFIMSVLVVLIIPIVVRLILRVIRGKR